MNRTRILSAVASVIATASFVYAADSSSFTGLPSSSSTTSPHSSSTSHSSSSSSASTVPYTTKKGDTLTGLAEQFNSSSRELKKLNHLTSSRLHAGMVLEVPAIHSTHHVAKVTPVPAKKPVVLTAQQQHELALQAALRATDKYSHHATVAQPVQDFDLSPSTFASCPPPPPNASGTNVAASSYDAAVPPVSAPPDSTPPAETAATVPAETSYPESLAIQNTHTLLPVPASLPPPAEPPPAQPQEAPAPASFSAAHSGPMTAALTSPVARTGSAPVLTPSAQPKKSFANALSDFFGGPHGMSATEAGQWGNRFLAETRNLAAQGVCYDGSWRPDGESHRWDMDCSNTTRYLYQVTAGIQLPRTASDQYYYLHLQDKAWDVPMTAAGFADCNYLRSNLKPGDLLFWENTYRPERQPPITHVMIFLGSDERGRWLMAGSQGSRGFYNRRHSGPDVYVFDPTHAVGGYTTWLGLEHHHGRFVAYGRPLEADVKKLSVAAND